MSSHTFSGPRRTLLVAAALLAVVVALFAFSTSAFAADLIVDDGGPTCAFGPAAHTTIQAAVNAANPDDTIKVCNGTYSENVTVDKRVTLLGQSPAAILDGGYYVTAPGAIIDGFTIKGASIATVYAGVALQADNVVIRNNTFTGPGTGLSPAYRGIELFGGNLKGLQAIDNTFDNWATGIYLNPGSDHLVLGNTFKATGAGLGTSGMQDVMVVGNVFEGPFDYEGVGADTAGAGNVIRGNAFTYATMPSMQYYGTGTMNGIDARFNFLASPAVGSEFNTSSALSAVPVERIVNDDGVGSPCVIGMPGYATVSAAVAAAVTGDTVRLCDGSYFENVSVVGKSLSFFGQSRTGVKIFATAPLTPNPTVYGFDVQSAPVIVRALSLWGSHDLAGYGLKIFSASDANVQDVSVYNSQRTNIDFNTIGSVTLKNVLASNAKWGNGVSLSNVASALVEDVTTRDNTWGGIALYPGSNPVNGVQFKGIVDNNEAFNVYIEPTLASPSVLNVGFNGLFRYMVQNDKSILGGKNFYAFAASGEEAATAAALANKFGGKSTITDLGANPASMWHFISPATSVNAAVAAASAGDTLVLGQGAYSEAIQITKHLRLIGAGSGAVVAEGNTHIQAVASPRIAIDIRASGLSAADPLLIKNLRVLPVDSVGISFNGETEGPESSPLPSNPVLFQYIKLDRVVVSGSASALAGENEFCFFQGEWTNVDGLEVTNSAFNNCDHGWLNQANNQSCNASVFKNVAVSNTEFRNNGSKGAYFEKLSDATFSNVLFANNGLRPQSGGNPRNHNGMDINLKWIYAKDIFLNNLSVVGNALGTAEGTGLSIKQRGGGSDSPSYSNPCVATLDNVQINGGVFAGNERGIRIGEVGWVAGPPESLVPTVNNPGPTNVVINGAGIYRNVQQYSGPQLANVGGDLIVTSVAAVSATGNWWGQATGPNPGQVVSTATSPATIDTSSPLGAYAPAATISVQDGMRRFWTPGGSAWNPPSGALPASLSMNVPLHLAPFANQVSQLTVRVDYDATCLDFSAVTGAPGGWIVTPQDDAQNGILDVYIGDQSAPFSVLSGGDFANLVFTVDDTCTDQTSNFDVSVVGAVCGDPTGLQDVTCSAVDGNLDLDFNTPLTALQLNGGTIGSVYENAPAPAVVGALTVSNGADVDAVVFAIEPDASAGTRCAAGTYNGNWFTISGTQLQTARIFDYETNPGPFSVCVKATDQRGSVIWQAMTINVNDVWPENDASLVILDSLVTPPLVPNVIREGSPNALEYPVTFNANGNTVTGLTFQLTYATTCLNFDGASLIAPGGSVIESPAGTLNFSFVSPPAGPGNIAILRFKGVVCAGLRNDVALGLSSANATNGSSPVAVNPLTGNTAIVIENSARGDCNANGFVNAADLSATVLEYWDVADQSHLGSGTPPFGWLQAPFAFFPGSPYGCDANGSLVTDISDVTCTVLGIFGGSCLTTAPVTAASYVPAVLRAPAVADQVVAISFQSGGQPVGVVGFTLTLDPEVALAGAADEAVAVNVPNAIKFVQYDAASRRLQVVLLSAMQMPIPPLPEGTLLTVAVQGSGRMALSDLSAGSVDGYDIPLIAEQEEPLNFMRLFLPSILR
jgi:hypothetical protein